MPGNVLNGLTPFLIVGAGGSLGAMARFAVNRAMLTHWPSHPGAGTLIVNLAGSLGIGFLLGASVEHRWLSIEWRIFLVTGVLGGLTTFSALALETVFLARETPYFWWGLLHAVSNFAGGILAVVLGEILAQRLVH